MRKRFEIPGKPFLSAAALATLAVLMPLIVVIAPSIRAQSAAAARPQFDVASVKPDSTENGHVDFLPVRSGDLVLMHNTQLQQIVMYAYRVRNSSQLVGFREVADSWKWYDIDARVAGSPTDDELRLMFQSLLEDRFKLKVHHETREMAVYKLVVAKGGPKLKLSTPEDYKTTVDDRPVVMKPGHLVIYAGITGAHLIGKGVTIAQLASQLGGELKDQVADATGITGTFDFDVVFTPDDAPPNGDFSAPTLSAALKTELGLALEKSKGPVEVLVLDHLEKLSPN